MSSFIAKLQQRLAKEESGFTLIELLIVLALQVGGNRVVCAQATVPVLTPPNSVSS